MSSGFRRNYNPGAEVDVHAALRFVPLALVILTLAAPGACSRFGSGVPKAQPLEPVAAILDAFQDHKLVALGEGVHGNSFTSTCFRPTWSGAA